MKRLLRWFKWLDADGFPGVGAPLEIIEFVPETGCVMIRPPCWRVELVVAWYDCWIGIYVDRKQRRVYILPIPCVGLCIYWG